VVIATLSGSSATGGLAVLAGPRSGAATAPAGGGVADDPLPVIEGVGALDAQPLSASRKPLAPVASASRTRRPRPLGVLTAPTLLWK
jgi:hypothetical protein